MARSSDIRMCRARCQPVEFVARAAQRVAGIVGVAALVKTGQKIAQCRPQVLELRLSHTLVMGRRLLAARHRRRGQGHEQARDAATVQVLATPPHRHRHVPATHRNRPHFRLQPNGPCKKRTTFPEHDNCYPVPPENSIRVRRGGKRWVDASIGLAYETAGRIAGRHTDEVSLDGVAGCQLNVPPALANDVTTVDFPLPVDAAALPQIVAACRGLS